MLEIIIPYNADLKWLWLWRI